MPSTGQEPDHRPAEPSLFESPQKQNLVFCLLIVLATVALYNPVTRAPFLNFDDNRYVTENPDVRDGLSWHSVAWAFQTSAEANWHPVTWLSHQLDCQVFGLNPAGPHTINVLLHTACAVLLFLILQSVTGMRGRSLMAAALFALHPINVESVAWIAERKNVLSMLFFLLPLAAYGWYARRPGIWRYLAVTLLYALGLLTKPQVITFPFALLLLDYWPLRRMSGADEMGGSEPHESRPAERGFIRLVWEKAPWFAMSAASALITMRVQSLARHEDIPVDPPGECGVVLCHVRGKSFLAGPSRASLSASGGIDRHFRRGSGGPRNSRRLSVSRDLSRTALPVRGLVLVSRNARTNDWTG